MATFSLPWNTATFSAILLPIIGTIDIDSVPAAITTSSSPVRMRSAASAIACTPEEQKRLIVIAGTLSGSPASSTPMRATFMPCSASGIAQPTITSPISRGSSPGTCAITPFSTCASMSSGRTLLNIPRGALPTGVRIAATMYASWICLLIWISWSLLRLLFLPCEPPGQLAHHGARRRIHLLELLALLGGELSPGELLEFSHGRIGRRRHAVVHRIDDGRVTTAGHRGRRAWIVEHAAREHAVVHGSRRGDRLLSGRARESPAECVLDGPDRRADRAPQHEHADQRKEQHEEH